MLRPPLAEDCLRRVADGRVRLEQKRAWTDGTTHLLFEPVECLENLAAPTLSATRVEQPVLPRLTR